MFEIEPVASRVPWMTAIGNHEVGFSKSFIPGGTTPSTPVLCRLNMHNVCAT